MSVAPDEPMAGTVSASVQEIILEIFVAMGSPEVGSRTTTKLVNICVAVWPLPTSYHPTKPGAVSSERGVSVLLMSTLRSCADTRLAFNKIAAAKTGADKK